MINPQPADHGYHFTVSFNYAGHDTFEDVAVAMQSFSDAFIAYAKNKKASLRVESFDHGSLQCNLVANQEAWVGVQIMSQDLGELEKGRRSALMPEAARRNLRRALQHVASIHVQAGDEEATLAESASPLLEDTRQVDAKREVSHSGVLDRVDLKSDAFRIMLPHGQRILCSPALPFVDPISACLRTDIPRLKVFGDGKYRTTDLLPASIHVKRVEVLQRPPSFMEVLGGVSLDLDREAIKRELQVYTASVEARFEAFASEEE